jgi:hypothetical protein
VDAAVSLDHQQEEACYDAGRSAEEHPGLERPVGHRGARPLRERAEVEQKAEHHEHDRRDEHGRQHTGSKHCGTGFSLSHGSPLPVGEGLGERSLSRENMLLSIAAALLGLGGAAAFAAYRAVSASSQDASGRFGEFASNLFWPGVLIFLAVAAVVWLGWKANLD